jgi:hypothetical protein
MPESVRGEGTAVLVGILAFGSLIGNPGEEIAAVEIKSERKHAVRTPFRVEFARVSRTRGGAPTLVPHENGAQVLAHIVVLETTVQDAKDRLWRRETGRMGQGGHYVPKAKPNDKTLIIDEYSLEGLPTVLAARFLANLVPLTATHLAECAIASVAKAPPGMDGISYLIDTMRDGISTPLSPSYASELLRLTGAASLEAARAGLIRTS